MMNTSIPGQQLNNDIAMCGHCSCVQTPVSHERRWNICPIIDATTAKRGEVSESDALDLSPCEDTGTNNFLTVHKLGV